MIRVIDETCHVKNLANFDTLISHIVSYGNRYRPVKPSIQLGSLMCTSKNSKAAINNLDQLLFAHQALLIIRDDAFEILRELNLSIFDELKLTSNITQTEAHMLVGTAKSVYKTYASQQRYDYLLDNFNKIIKLLMITAQYHPVHPDLQITALQKFYQWICEKNVDVKKHDALVSNGKLIRNEIMYRENYGLVDIANTVKTYVKYQFGLDSRQFKEISGLVIKRFM